MATPLLFDPLPLETPRALYDATRLLGGRRRPFATGVDRIDLALALQLAGRLGPDCRFVCATTTGPALLDAGFAAGLLAALSRRWIDGAQDGGLRDRDVMGALARGLLAGGLPDFGRSRAEAARTTYVNAGHTGLPRRPGALARIDPAGRMRRMFYIHDLIPLEFPEYQTPASARAFAIFLAGAGERPARFLTNSRDTARRLAAHALARGWPDPDIAPMIPRIPAPDVAPPERLRPALSAWMAEPRPFFLTVGTIEPRKNHLLLLHLWRAMAATDPAPPRLAIVGRRGWENEMVVDMLERCAPLKPHVAEFGDLTDGETAALMTAAQALLIPSFAEGLGVPVMEAAALGTRVLASDLPALREIAGPGAAFLDPLDGPGWARAIAAAAADDDDADRR